MNHGLLLVGASGLAREVLAAGIVGVTGIVDDDHRLHGTAIGGVPVVGAIDAAAERDDDLLVCIGAGAARRGIVDRLRSLGVADERFATFVARSARIGTTSTIGRGSIVLDGVVVSADASLGAHIVVMPNSIITHDDVLEDFVTLAAGVALGGTVRVGEAAYLGMNSSVRQGLSVGSDATIGMGSVVLDDVPDGQTWVGVPARPTRVFA